MNSLFIPPSKSHTLRAILFAMMGKGKSKITHFLPSPDTQAMLKAIEQLGAKVKHRDNTLEITGGFEGKDQTIDAGNSGIVLRFIGALSALLPQSTLLTGDASIRQRRPVLPLIGALRELGASATSLDHAPLLIKGPIRPGLAHLNGEDSQPVSALLIATSFLKGPSQIKVENPGELPWIELTLYWLKKLGAQVTHQNYTHYEVAGGLSYEGFEYAVPGDFSSGAFPFVAALITGSELTLENLDFQDPQGDKLFFTLAEQMGAKFQIRERAIAVFLSPDLQGMRIDVNPCIDALPILAVLGCFAKGTTELFNGRVARLKESDRIRAITQELKKMGANIEEKPDGLIVKSSSLHGAQLSSHGDHRIAMALAVASLRASSPSTIEGFECTAKTYPNFEKDLEKLATIRI